jgi:hypothetical protein
VIRVDTQASDAADERPAEVQSQRRSPKGRLGRAIEESGRNEQYWSRQKPWREPQDGALLLRLVPGSDGVERHVQEPYSEVRYTEDHTPSSLKAPGTASEATSIAAIAERTTSRAGNASSADTALVSHE